MYGIIYRAFNKINGKSYIGQTSRPLEERIYEHNLVAKKNGDYMPLICRAIAKYGETNFQWSIIDEAETKEKLDEKESFWITHYHTFIKFENCNGYNMTMGGDGVSGRIVSDETRRKISQAQIGKEGLKGEENPMYGRVGESSPMYGKSGELSPTSIPVVKLSINGEFIDRYSSAVDGAKSISDKYLASSITKCCKGTSRHCKGFIWLYENDYNEKNVRKAVENAKTKRKGRKVIQLSLNGEFIAEYESIKKAEVAIVGKSVGAIVNVCNGKYKQYKGFKWVYSDDYLELGDVNE